MPVDICPIRIFEHTVRYAPQTVTFEYEGRQTTAHQAWHDARRIAVMLRASGVHRGDRVAFLGLNSPVLLTTYLACSHLGAVFLPVNFRLAAREILHLLADAEPSVLVCEPGLTARVDAVRDEIPGVDAMRLLVVDGDPADPLASEPGQGWHRLSDALSDADPEQAGTPAACHEDDLAALLYTSGTTGRAKGVMLTHGNLFWHQVNTDSVQRTARDDVTLAAAPLFHIGALNSYVLRTMVRGGTVVIRRTFDPQQALADIEKLRVTTLFGVPAMLAAMTRAEGFADADLTSIRATMVAGAPVPPQLIQRYADRGIYLQQAWGLTETSPCATYVPDAYVRTKIGAAGVPMPWTEVKIVEVGLGDEITEPGVRGELCVRGPNVSPGYWRNEVATQAAFDSDGWFHSGDIGRYDDEGFVYIVDRLKDMIISGGENVYPAEVEHVVIDMPGVVEVAVVGTPDETWGETVCAVITTEPGVEITVEQVREFAASRLARYKLPTRLVVVPSLPRTGSGKLDKVSLRTTVGDSLEP